MQRKIVFRNKAVSEIETAYRWYENQKEGLGSLFLENIECGITAIVENPNAFQFIHKEFRHIPLNKFPFVLIYKIYSSEIVVFAVFHTKRNPKNKY